MAVLSALRAKNNMRSCIVLILKQQNNEIEVYSSLSALIKARKENLGISKFTLDRLDLEKGYENEFVRIKKCKSLSVSDI